MELPFFYTDTGSSDSSDIILDESNSKHIIQVLRMKSGESLLLTEGKGNLYHCMITVEDKKKCVVRVMNTIHQPERTRKVSVGLSLLKNPARFEWFLEKATELGVSEIIPMRCDRTEKHDIRPDRMKNILVSALLQSRQVWLPRFTDPVDLRKFVRSRSDTQKFIAHCGPGEKMDLVAALQGHPLAQFILIGPEGDFSPAEIELAQANQFTPVSLGQNRLRSETAAIVAVTLLTRQPSV